MKKKDFNKLVISLRYFLLGKGYNFAIEALEYAKAIHCGTRKDKVTPEFQHQVEIALYLTTIANISNLEEVIIVALLHDIEEDYNIDREELTHRFGELVEQSVYTLSKIYKGEKKKLEDYFEHIANDPIASIVKGVDRINNLSDMVGIFTPHGQQKYIDDVHEYFFPMLKKARKNFPAQMLAYHNITTMLRMQVTLIQHILEKK